MNKILVALVLSLLAMSADAALEPAHAVAAPKRCAPGQTAVPIYNAAGAIVGWKCVGPTN